MIHLFPKIKNRMLLYSACFIAMVGVYMALNPGLNPLIALLIAVIGVIVILVSQLINASSAHAQLLGKLYNQLDVEGFIRDYSRFLSTPLKNPNLRLMVRLHLSNAYCAQGEFEKAKELLTGFRVEKSKKPEEELLSRFAIVSNLCYCCEQQEDVETAQKYLDELLALKKQLEALQAAKPEKKRMVFNTELNEQCMKYLTTGSADIEALKTLVQNSTQQLHKVTLSLWVARCYLAINNRREAETLLERIVNLAPDLYPGKTAAKILAALPGNNEKNA